MAERKYVKVADLKIANPIFNLIEELLPNAGINIQTFYSDLADIVSNFTERNKLLLDAREKMQQKIDTWHRAREGKPHDQTEYEKFLKAIGYIVDDPGKFKIGTQNLDNEIASLAGPQLVAPVANDRLATNAANARWVSLYGAIYNSNMIANEGELKRGGSKDPYNPLRGAEVIKFTENLLDETFPLKGGAKHADAVRYEIKPVRRMNWLVAVMQDGKSVPLENPAQFAGHQGERQNPSTVLLFNNGLHLELNIDREAERGRIHPAGIQDITIESALTTIMDLEDSVAIVDADDKAEAYRNMQQLLDSTIIARWRDAEGEIAERRMVNQHRVYQAHHQVNMTLPNRSLMLFRNVGLFMPPNESMRDQKDRLVPEGIIDAVMTALIAKPDVRLKTNSHEGSIYIVMPKMHGPEEVKYASDLFARVENLVGLNRNTIKMGIMDEERRTSVNLKACIAAARDRIFFVNTGFLDRTGDEYRTSMHAGLLEPKQKMRGATWFNPYEISNVDTALEAGASKKMQVGKGMWAEPNNMQGLYATKGAQLEAGATTAWVPSPSAAAIHAMHYLQRNVIWDVHPQLMQRTEDQVRANHAQILHIPFAGDTVVSEEERQRYLDENVQGVLGYAARWVKLGIGCSSVPNFAGVDLMEDCATVRISVMNVANWRLQGMYTKDDIEKSLVRMAAKVDEQNAKTDNYRPMMENFDGDHAVKAARDLLTKGERLPNGYVQPELYKYRKFEKERYGAKADPPWRAPGLREGLVPA